jgi:hypothetical protein
MRPHNRMVSFSKMALTVLIKFRKFMESTHLNNTAQVALPAKQQYAHYVPKSRMSKPVLLVERIWLMFSTQ